MWFVMVIVVSVCGQSGFSEVGCSVTSTTIDFPTMEACEASRTRMFTKDWQPKREIICLSKEFPK